MVALRSDEFLVVLLVLFAVFKQVVSLEASPPTIRSGDVSITPFPSSISNTTSFPREKFMRYFATPAVELFDVMLRRKEGPVGLNKRTAGA
jgi:hypothetical protein